MRKMRKCLTLARKLYCGEGYLRTLIILTPGSNLLRTFLSSSCGDDFIARGRLWFQTFNEDNDLHRNCINILLNPVFLRFLWIYLRDIVACGWIKSEFHISPWIKIKITIHHRIKRKI
ncbi:unnamed protein product [Chironomus riparius]|uniref:Uncharacterized protein n=1 Tax=Chironomus riparius TaxID=315576 RepID=A0A9N9WQ16_9DIPT|nr:unnamed protein product [Chironomus riparius]